MSLEKCRKVKRSKKKKLREGPSKRQLSSLLRHANRKNRDALKKRQENAWKLYSLKRKCTNPQLVLWTNIKTLLSLIISTRDISNTCLNNTEMMILLLKQLHRLPQSTTTRLRSQLTVKIAHTKLMLKWQQQAEERKSRLLILPHAISINLRAT